MILNYDRWLLSLTSRLSRDPDKPPNLQRSCSEWCSSVCWLSHWESSNLSPRINMYSDVTPLPLPPNYESATGEQSTQVDRTKHEKWLRRTGRKNRSHFHFVCLLAAFIKLSILFSCRAERCFYWGQTVQLHPQLVKAKQQASNMTVNLRLVENYEATAEQQNCVFLRTLIKNRKHALIPLWTQFSLLCVQSFLFFPQFFNDMPKMDHHPLFSKGMSH